MEILFLNFLSMGNDGGISALSGALPACPGISWKYRTNIINAMIPRRFTGWGAHAGCIFLNYPFRRYTIQPRESHETLSRLILVHGNEEKISTSLRKIV
jgi:hypothetical protein